MRRALAELRLIFHAMADPEQFHAPYLQRNRIIAEAIMLGQGEAAEKELMSYLADAERQILDVYRVPALELPAVRFRPAGPSALLVEVDSLDEARALHAEIEPPSGPAAGRRPCSTWCPAPAPCCWTGCRTTAAPPASIRSWTIPPVPAGQRPGHEIHCRYDGPDLAAVAAQWGVSVAGAVRLHTSIEHEVAFCGFAPGFPYIAGIGRRP